MSYALEAYRYAKAYRKSQGGFHPPGYRYLGPGTIDTNRKPKNRLDRQAQIHDRAYEKLGARYGKKRYTHYSNADRMFLKNIRNERGLYAGTARALFKLKRKYAPRFKFHKKYGAHRRYTSRGVKTRHH